MFKKLLLTLLVLTLISAIGIGIYVGIREGFFVDIYECVTAPISFTLKDNLPDSDGEKAKVIILAGQSNAAGCSHVEYLQKSVSEEKFTEYEEGYDNVYINFFSTKKNMSSGFVKCAIGQGDDESLFGPEVGMAEKLNELYPDQKFFIIKYAWSATSLFEDWLSPSSVGRTGSKYKQFEVFVNTSLKYLIDKGYDVEIEGMCWMQGESDSFSVENGVNYSNHLTNFIQDIRKEFSKYAADDGIAFIDATIAYLPAYWVFGELVNQSKWEVTNSVPMTELVDTGANGLTTENEPFDNPDKAHYDALSEIQLGHLFIEKLAQYI